MLRVDTARWWEAAHQPVTQSDRRRRAQRFAPALLVGLLLPLVLVTPSALAAPATDAEMNLYTRILAINVCLSQAVGVDLQKAVGIAGETLTQLVLVQHQGAIAQVGPKPLSLEDLRRGSVNSALFGAVEMCPKQLPADLVKQVEAAMRAEPGAPAAAPASAPAAAPTAAPAASRPVPTRAR